MCSLKKTDGLHANKLHKKLNKKNTLKINRLLKKAFMCY